MPALLQLGYEAVSFTLIGVICSWMAWVWTHEEIFVDFQNVFKAAVEKHKPLMSNAYNQKRWRSMIYHWFLQKACTGLSCHTCCGHYPALLFVSTGGYRLIDSGWRGFLYAWFFTAFVSDQTCSVIEYFRTAKKIEKAEADKVKNEAPYVQADNQLEEHTFAGNMFR